MSRRTPTVLAVALLVTAPAAVQQPGHARTSSDEMRVGVVVSENPAEKTPDVLDGTVRDAVQIGGTMYLAGTFTKASNAGSNRVQRHRGVLAFDVRTGRLVRRFDTQILGEVTSIAANSAGTRVFVAGAFHRVNGRRWQRVVSLRRNGTIDGRFRPPVPNASVDDLEVSRDRLYLAGHFVRLGSHRRLGLAEVDPRTGRLRSRFHPSVHGLDHGGYVHVGSLDMADDGRRMVIAGNFSRVDGRRRSGLAQLVLERRRTRVLPWRTTRFQRRCSKNILTPIRGVAYAPGGRWFVTVSTGSWDGGPPSLCDTVARWESGRDRRAHPTWVDYTGGDSVYAVAIDDTAVYVGGHFRWLNNPYSQDARGPGAVVRTSLAALDPVNGLPYPWNPGRARGVGVQILYPTSRGLYVGSDTELVGGERHARIAFFPVQGGAPVIPTPSLALPVDAYLLGGVSPWTVVRRRITSGGVVEQGSSEEAQSWDGVRATTVIAGDLYAANQSGALHRRSFDQGVVGPSVLVPLRGLHSFARELSTMTSLTYSHGRLYYTLEGRTALFMRFFGVDDQIVGAQRFVVTRGWPALPLQRVAGVFVASGRFYWVDAADGALRSVEWRRHRPVRGPVRLVSGPQVDGLDWRPGALVASPGS